MRPADRAGLAGQEHVRARAPRRRRRAAASPRATACGHRPRRPPACRARAPTRRSGPPVQPSGTMPMAGTRAAPLSPRHHALVDGEPVALQRAEAALQRLGDRRQPIRERRLEAAADDRGELRRLAPPGPAAADRTTRVIACADAGRVALAGRARMRRVEDMELAPAAPARTAARGPAPAGRARTPC